MRRKRKRKSNGDSDSEEETRVIDVSLGEAASVRYIDTYDGWRKSELTSLA